MLHTFISLQTQQLEINPYNKEDTKTPPGFSYPKLGQSIATWFEMSQ